MPPNAPAAVGKEAIKSAWQASFDQFASELTITTEETETAGDWTFGRGTYTVVLTPKAGGEPTEDTGKWLSISRRQTDGSWKIHRHIWNSDKPVPGTGD